MSRPAARQEKKRAPEGALFRSSVRYWVAVVHGVVLGAPVALEKYTA